MSRIFVRALLTIALCVSLSVIIASLLLLGLRDSAAVVAASLAVTASLVSAWTGQRVLELQEDAQQPYPYPFFDVTSRYSVMQLRVTNFGGSVARDINLKCDNPLLNAKGDPVTFSEQEGAPDIAVLLPGQSVTTPVGTDEEIFGERTDLNYSGSVKFKTASGKDEEHPFYLSAEQYRHTLAYDEEQLKTHHQLQQIPKEVKTLRNEIKRFGKR